MIVEVDEQEESVEEKIAEKSGNDETFVCEETG